MPKIEIKQKDLNSLLKKKLNLDELESLLESAKAEIDDSTDDTLKIELNDTNRPDLWTTAGLARQINQYLELQKYEYSFYNKKSEFQIIVDKNVKAIRPYIIGFAVKNIKIDESLLLELIQNQEKFAMNFGKKRSDIAIGIYKYNRIKFPIHYKAVKPENMQFVPLGLEKKLNLKEILKEHPKGVEFGHIIKNYKEYPIIVDHKDNVLSMPPIINSKFIGEVEEGDNDIFIELTGFNLTNILLVANIFASDLSDRGGEIIPIDVIYPEKTSFGKEIKIPYDLNNIINISIKEFDKLIGFNPDLNEIIKNLNKMGYIDIEENKDKLDIIIPNYRNDIMHLVDIVEDYVIGKGYNNIDIKMPKEFTIGTLSDEEILIDKIRDCAIGMDFQEIISNILTSETNLIKNMNQINKNGLCISNPMTESYNMLRNSIIPCLLEVEAISAKAAYPHRIFEVGEVMLRDEKENYGYKTIICIGLLCAHPKTNFSEMRSYVDNILYYAGIDNFSLESSQFNFLLKGRNAKIIKDKTEIGYFGEIDPTVLERWDINMPCSVIEINLSNILNIIKK